MASRNLTKRFVELRNGAKANRNLHMQNDNVSENSDNGLIGSGAETTNWKAIKETLPPRWVDKIENVEGDASKISKSMKELSGLHTRRLMVNFESDEVEQEREIDYKTREITELFRHANGLLSTFKHEGEAVGISIAEKTVRTNMQRSLAKKLQGLSMSFKSTQKEYLSRLQTQQSKGGQGIFNIIDEDSGNVGYDTGFQQGQLAVLDNTIEEVNQRDVEITKIAKSIEELAEIFKELAVLVIDQGTILDRIDFNMESAVDHATVGNKELAKAETSQKNALPMRCIILLVVLIAIMLVVLIVKNSPKSSSK